MAEAQGAPKRCGSWRCLALAALSVLGCLTLSLLGERGPFLPVLESAQWAGQQGAGAAGAAGEAGGQGGQEGQGGQGGVGPLTAADAHAANAAHASAGLQADRSREGAGGAGEGEEGEEGEEGTGGAEEGEEEEEEGEEEEEEEEEEGAGGGAGHEAAAGAHATAAGHAAAGADASGGPHAAAAKSGAGPGGAGEGDDGGGLAAKSAGNAEGKSGASGATDVVLPARRPIQWGFTFGENSTIRSFEEWDMKSGWSAPARPGIDLKDTEAWPSVDEDPNGWWSLEGLERPLIYTVSMPQMVERRKHFARLFRGLKLRHGFQWAPAIDEQLVPPDLKWMSGGGKQRKDSRRQPGVWGCYITHLAIMREAHQRCPSCDLVVFEDGIVFRPNFLHHWSSFYSSLPNDWSILRLGAEFLLEPPLDVASESLRIRSAWKTWGYVVRASKLKRLGDLLASLPMRGSGIDRVMQLFATELATFMPSAPLLYGASDCRDKDDQADCGSRKQLQRSAKKVLKAWPLGYARSYCSDRGIARPQDAKTLQEACTDMQSKRCCPYKSPPLAQLPKGRLNRTKGTEIEVWNLNLGDRRYYIAHIPKAAGTSLAFDLCGVVPGGMKVVSAEMCASALGKMRKHPGDGFGVIIRQPRTHVFSQFLMCKTSSWGQAVVPKNKKHIIEKFQTWLEHFHKPGQLDALSCYHPESMQTRTLSCLNDNDEASHHAFGSHKNPIRVKDPLGEALKTLRSMTFVGVVERYQESLCLFAAIAGPTQELPFFCNCADRLAWSLFKSTRESHGVPGHSIKNVTEEEMRLLDELTLDDAKLYKAAVQRFEADVRAVEKTRRVQILCSPLTEHL